MLTALLGLMVFGERLPPLWWLGAALLVVGNVVIGRREEEDGAGKKKKDGFVMGEGQRDGVDGDAVGLDARDGGGRHAGNYRDEGEQEGLGDAAAVK